MQTLKQSLKCFTLALVFCLAIPALTIVQAHTPMPNMPGMPGLPEQVQLTDQTAKNALDGFLAMKTKFEDDRMAEFEQSLAQLESQKLPEPMRNQMIEMLEGIKPSDNNLEIVQVLINDPEYGPKIAEAK